MCTVFPWHRPAMFCACSSCHTRWHFSMCMSELRQQLGEISSWIHISVMPQLAASGRLRTAECSYIEGPVDSWCSRCWAGRLAAPHPNILQVLKWQYVFCRNPLVGLFAFHLQLNMYVTLTRAKATAYDVKFRCFNISYFMVAASVFYMGVCSACCFAESI